VTFDGAAARMFINGSLVAEKAVKGGLPMGAGDQLGIGRFPELEAKIGAQRRTLRSDGSRIVKFFGHDDKLIVVSVGGAISSPPTNMARIKAICASPTRARTMISFMSAMISVISSPRSGKT
jgi:hypothetical protein